MPYSNVPEELWSKMDRCVKDVMDDQGVEKERAIAICHRSVVGKTKSIAFNGIITKAQRMADGRVRWKARVNSGEFDQAGEKLDATLFEDVAKNFAIVQEALSKGESAPIERQVNGATLSMDEPILDIAHYSYFLPKSEREKARAGYPVKVWIDGRAFMAQGYYDDTPQGRLASEAALSEKDPEKRRVSIGVYPDWGLVEEYPDGRRVYKGGRGRSYLDHLAMTAYPVDADTEIVTLSEVNDMPSQKEDALKVLGEGAEDLVDELEKARVKAKSDPLSALLKSDDGEAEAKDEAKDGVEAEVQVKAEEDTGTENEADVKGGDEAEAEAESESTDADEAQAESEGETEDEAGHDDVAAKTEAMMKTIITRLVEALPPVMDARIKANLESLDLGDLQERLKDIEAKLSALTAGETAKLQATIDSKDGDWMLEVITKNFSENSVQRSNAAVKGESTRTTGQAAMNKAGSQDSEFMGLFGNPGEGGG